MFGLATKKQVLEMQAKITELEAKSVGAYADTPGWSNYSGATNKYRTSKEQLTSFEGKLVWFSACVDKLMSDAGGREYYFENTATGERLDDRLIDERILLPFRNGYYKTTIRGMTAMVVGHRAYVGNAYWWIRPGTMYGKDRGINDTFVPLLPYNVKPLISLNGLHLEGYRIEFADGRECIAAPDEIIHFKQSLLTSPFIGVGNITKARLIAESDTAGEQYQNEFMDRKATPSMVLTNKTLMSPEDNERVMNILASKYEGKQNAGKVMYLGNFDGTAQLMQLTQKDMQFVEQKVYNRQAMITINGLNTVVMGIPDGANNAIARTMRLVYLANTANSIIGSIENDLNEQFVHKIDPNTSLCLKRWNTGDIDEVKRMVEAGLITPNRGSELLGEESDDTDQSRSSYYIGAGFVPLGYVSEPVPATQTDGNSGKTHGCVDHKEADLTNPKNIEAICDHFIKSSVNPKKFQVKYLRASLTSRAKIEDTYSYKLDRYFDEQKKRVLDRFNEHFGGKNIKSYENAVELIFDMADESEELKAVVKGIHTAGVSKAVIDINGITKSSVNSQTSNPYVQAAINRIGKLVGTKVEGVIQETTRKYLERVILSGVEDNLHASEIAQNLAAKFDQFQGYRSRVIARTETARAWSAGAEVSYRELGVKFIDVVGCTMFEPDSDCGAQHVPIAQMATLSYHPNHIGTECPSEEI